MKPEGSVGAAVGALAAMPGVIAAAASACAASHNVGSRPVPTHRCKPVEVLAISGSELCTLKQGDFPAWVNELKLVASERRFTIFSGSEAHGLKISQHGGALDWLVKWPDGRVEILDDRAFNLRFEPMRYPDVVAILHKEPAPGALNDTRDSANC